MSSPKRQKLENHSGAEPQGNKFLLSLRLTLQLKRSLGGYSHRERCRAPDTHDKIKTRAVGKETKTLQAIGGSRRHFATTQGVRNSPSYQEESETAHHKNG